MTVKNSAIANNIINNKHTFGYFPSEAGSLLGNKDGCWNNQAREDATNITKLKDT